MSSTPALVFSYGTLQHIDVQIAAFGRKLPGRKDALSGYTRRMISIGESNYFNLEPSSDLNDEVSGTVLEMTGQELAAADKYEETTGYCRIFVTLKSGIEAWVYVHAARGARL